MFTHVLTVLDVVMFLTAAQQLSVSQKIKTTYKASTSKLVSSFRAPNNAYSLVRTYRGHRDGVWEVCVSRSNHQIVGTASAGEFCLLLFFLLDCLI